MFVLKPSALFKSIYFWTKSRHFELSWWLRVTLQSLGSTKRLVTLFFCTELLWVSCKLLHIEYLGTASNGAGNFRANSWKKNSLYIWANDWLGQPSPAYDWVWQWKKLELCEHWFTLFHYKEKFQGKQAEFNKLWVYWTISWAVLLIHYVRDKKSRHQKVYFVFCLKL